MHTTNFVCVCHNGLYFKLMVHTSLGHHNSRTFQGITTRHLCEHNRVLKCDIILKTFPFEPHRAMHTAAVRM